MPTLKELKTKLNISIRDTLFSIGIIVLACILCTPLQLINEGDFHVPIIFVLAVLLISRFTDGYFYGIVASILSLFCVNYIFTYPYFAFNFTITGYPLTFISMLVVSLITSAMTSQIKMQEKIHREVEKEKMKANLLRAVSHDIRTPLTSIVGSITTVQENDESLSTEKRNELLLDAKEDSLWLIRMVENVLTMTRIEDSETQITKNPEAVEEVISEAVYKYKKQFPHMKVSVSIPDELLMIPVDAMLIEQVIINLLFNSSVHGEHVDEISIKIIISGKNAHFSIKDNGVGFYEDSLPNIFEGYYSNIRKKGVVDDHHNMGIGLSTCVSIIRAHGGEMSARNHPSGGAVVDFTIPLREDK